MSLETGRKLAHYEILELIGKGGMGEVYRARDTKLGREVAIKVLPGAVSENTERLARFEREARLLASLNHPGIATLYGLEESEGVHYLVMELVEGETLAERIRKGRLPIDEWLSLFKQIAEALEAAHEKGIVHRDLKPANIMVTPEGKAKVLDFGLAKAFGREFTGGAQSESPTITREGTEVGVILGTAAYMSPEQARGKTLDTRTDIWSFGCVFYEALSGNPAFLGDTVSDTIARILEREPDWRALPANTPATLRSLLRRCLQKDSSRRVHHVADVRIEIEESLAEPEPVHAAVAGGGRARRALVVTILVALFATGVALWSLTRSSEPATQPITRIAMPFPTGAEVALHNFPAVALSPDGRQVAYVGESGNTTRLYLRALDELDPRPLDGTDGARMPFFSPDGQWLGFVNTDRKLMKVSVGGGAPVVISEQADVRGASWSLDGRVVFTIDAQSGLSRVSANGGSPEALTSPDGVREDSHRFPEVLPGGKAILFSIGTPDLDSWDDGPIAVLSLETREYRVLLEGGSNPRYSSSGHLVYAREGALHAVAFDRRALRVTGAPVRVLEGVVSSPLHGHANFSLSRDGSLLYLPGKAQTDDRRLVWVDREGRSQPLIETPRPFLAARISPDGRSLALDVEGPNRSLWLYDFARSTLTRLVFGYDNRDPTWRPDGASIVFSSNRSGGSLFRIAADGSDQAEPLTESEHLQMPSSWSPDGKAVAFDEVRPNTGDDIWILFMDGDRKAELFLGTNFNERRPMFSPDGRWIAYESDESGRYEIYLRPFPGPGARRQVSSGGGTQAVWNASGRELFYRSGDEVMVVDVRMEIEFALGNPRPLFERPQPFPDTPYWGRDYDAAPDGQRFIMIENAEPDPPPTQLILVQNWAEELKRLVPPDN